MVTNQPDVARGTQTAEAVEEIHRRIAGALPVDDFLSCFHDDGDGCGCRKPKPGLILDGAGRHGVDLAPQLHGGGPLARHRRGAAAGCRTVWIDRGYRERGPSAPADARVRSLGEAAAWIAEQITVGERIK